MVFVLGFVLEGFNDCFHVFFFYYVQNKNKITSFNIITINLLESRKFVHIPVSSREDNAERPSSTYEFLKKEYACPNPSLNMSRQNQSKFGLNSKQRFIVH